MGNHQPPLPLTTGDLGISCDLGPTGGLSRARHVLRLHRVPWTFLTDPRWFTGDFMDFLGFHVSFMGLSWISWAIPSGQRTYSIYELENFSGDLGGSFHRSVATFTMSASGPSMVWSLGASPMGLSETQGY